MNDFFTNLVSRHLGTCDSIQPRTLGRFEVNRGAGALTEALVSPDEDINPVVSGVEVPKVSLHEFDLTGSIKDYSSPSYPEQSDTLTQLDVTEQQEVLPDSHSLSKRPYGIHPFDEVVSDTLLPNSRAAEHAPENELSHRIRAMLQRLMGDSESPVADPTLDDQGSQHNESQISIPSEAKISLLNAGGRGENTALYDPLEPPSWLPEIETRFNPHLKDKEVQTEPVINVTIGRVEVRAIQTDSATQAKTPNKPSGIMSLDDYLTQRNRKQE